MKIYLVFNLIIKYMHNNVLFLLNFIELLN